jgi:hypothetical protein
MIRFGLSRRHCVAGDDTLSLLILDDVCNDGKSRPPLLSVLQLVSV